MHVCLSKKTSRSSPHPHRISHPPGLMELENREWKQLQKQEKVLTGSLQKLNAQIHEKGKERMLLEEKKLMMEMDFLGRLKVGWSQSCSS